MKIRFLVVAALVAGGVIIASPLAPAQDGAAPAATAPAAEWLPSNTILPTGQVVLPDGWKISPVGRTVELPGDMPNRMLLTPDQKYLLVSTGGYNEHGLTVLDARTLAKVDHSAVPQTFSGLCTDAAGQHVLLSPGGSAAPATLYSFALHDGHLKAEPGLDVPAIPKSNRFIGGVVQDAGGTTYIADINADTIYRAVPGGQPATSAKVGYRPCALALSPDGALLAVANWGEQSVALLKAADLAPQARLAVGSHPADVCWSKDGRLFVANAGGDTVSVISPQSGRVVETIRTALDFQVSVGSTPLALAVDPAGTRLYVANAGNNDVAVVDITRANESKVLGFIPTGWYPCAVAVAGDGQTLYIGTGKGLTFGPNGASKTFIGKMLRGHVAAVPVPDAVTLAGYTRQVVANTPLPQPATAAPDGQALAAAFNQIQHVLYIIKENRTYDQVFGDMPEGHGDPNLTLFGEKITPNQHALARQWVLFDNLYCNGEVSVDGHAWCDAAYANDFNRRSWTNTYSQRLAPAADGRLTRSPGGYIWDAAIAHQLTFRTYGEGAEFVASPEMAPEVTDPKMRAAFTCAAWQGGIAARDYLRITVFLDELRAAEKAGKWPNLMVMSLPENHTYGRAAGRHTPEAMVGSNDLAVGMAVEAVTHSSFWPHTAIFIIEDDAQNGHDHIDAHRTVGLVLSPYTRRGFVDHTMYTTASMLRTMELMLHLPPLTQYDAAATPMLNAFEGKPDLGPYTLRKSQIDLAAKNPARGTGAKASAALDFSDIDRADAAALNAILWAYCKPGIPEPAPVRSLVLVR